MKIKEISRSTDNYGVFIVTFTPNWLEKLIGIKEKQEQYKDTGAAYTFGGGHVYIDKGCNELGNGHPIASAIDKFRNKW